MHGQQNVKKKKPQTCRPYEPLKLYPTIYCLCHLFFNTTLFTQTPQSNNSQNNLAVPLRAMQVYCVAEIQTYSFLPSALDGREWSTSRLAHFTSKGNPGIVGREGCVAPRDGLKLLEGEKCFSFAGIRTPNRPACSLVAIPTTQSRFL